MNSPITKKRGPRPGTGGRPKLPEAKVTLQFRVLASTLEWLAKQDLPPGPWLDAQAATNR